MVTGGMILGLGAARAAAPLIASILYGVTPWDVGSLIAAAVIVLAIAALAAAIPASRAARINPAVALRDFTG
jgi:ABC-type lipoprotein release transport system permease subunit